MDGGGRFNGKRVFYVAVRMVVMYLKSFIRIFVFFFLEISVLDLFYYLEKCVSFVNYGSEFSC